MTDQTESASDDYPICEDECVTWGGHADNCRVPAAIRALEAKVREAETNIAQWRHQSTLLEYENAGLAANQCLHDAIVGDDGGNSYCTVKAERDRLAGEVERLRKEQPTREDVDDITEAGRLMASAAKKIMALSAEVARLTAELAVARENEARWKWMFPDSPLVSVTERMQRVYRKWDGSDSWNDAVDAARRAGEGEPS